MLHHLHPAQQRALLRKARTIHLHQSLELLQIARARAILGRLRPARRRRRLPPLRLVRHPRKHVQVFQILIRVVLVLVRPLARLARARASVVLERPRAKRRRQVFQQLIVVLRPRLLPPADDELARRVKPSLRARRRRERRVDERVDPRLAESREVVLARASVRGVARDRLRQRRGHGASPRGRGRGRARVATCARASRVAPRPRVDAYG